MKEETVTFYMAKLAKEVGFQNKTPHKLRKNYYNYLGELNGDCTAYIKRFANEEDTSEFVNVEAPTQSLLQRWLREVHNIEVLIARIPPEAILASKNSGKNILRNYNCYVWNLDGNPRIANKGSFKNTYEEALEAGLQEALKYIL